MAIITFNKFLYVFLKKHQVLQKYMNNRCAYLKLPPPKRCDILTCKYMTSLQEAFLWAKTKEGQKFWQTFQR